MKSLLVAAYLVFHCFGINAGTSTVTEDERDLHRKALDAKLQAAIEGGDLKTVKRLVEDQRPNNKIDLNDTSWWRNNPLTTAFEAVGRGGPNSLEVVLYLLENPHNQADPNSVRPDPLCTAAMLGSMPLARLFVEKYRRHVDVSCYSYRKGLGNLRAPIIVAAYLGHTDVVRLLLAHGASLEPIVVKVFSMVYSAQRDFWFQIDLPTAFFVAKAKRHEETARVLMESGRLDFDEELERAKNVLGAANSANEKLRAKRVIKVLVPLAAEHAQKRASLRESKAYEAERQTPLGRFMTALGAKNVDCPICLEPFGSGTRIVVPDCACGTQDTTTFFEKNKTAWCVKCFTDAQKVRTLHCPTCHKSTDDYRVKTLPEIK